MISIISVGRRPNLSAIMPKRNAPTGRMASVMKTASKTEETFVWKSALMALTQKTRMKKSKASRDQPIKQAMKVFRWTAVRLCKRRRKLIGFSRESWPVFHRSQPNPAQCFGCLNEQRRCNGLFRTESLKRHQASWHYFISSGSLWHQYRRARTGYKRWRFFTHDWSNPGVYLQVNGVYFCQFLTVP